MTGDFATRPHHFVADLSQIAAGVATTSGKSLHNFCVSPKTDIPLHRQSEQTTSERQDKKH
jgi:hypothetical protein